MFVLEFIKKKVVTMVIFLYMIIVHEIYSLEIMFRQREGEREREKEGKLFNE